MKEHIKQLYYTSQVKRIMKKLDDKLHSKETVERMINYEPVIVKEIVMELLKEKNYFNK